MKIKNIIAVIALALSFIATLHAQKTVTWKGGTPGQENDWNCAKNWSSHKVPDEFSNVVIPDVSTTTLAAPVIKNGTFEVNAIIVHSNAKLTVEKDAQLVIYTTEGDCLDTRGFNIKGSLLLLDFSQTVIADRSKK